MTSIEKIPLGVDEPFAGWFAKVVATPFSTKAALDAPKKPVAVRPALQLKETRPLLAAVAMRSNVRGANEVLFIENVNELGAEPVLTVLAIEVGSTTFHAPNVALFAWLL